MAAATRTSSKRQVSVGNVAAVLEVRAELADTPAKAAATRPRSKRQVSPGMNTPQAPAAKKGMVEDSEEEEEDGTDADMPLRTNPKKKNASARPRGLETRKFPEKFVSDAGWK